MISLTNEIHTFDKEAPTKSEVVYKEEKKSILGKSIMKGCKREREREGGAVFLPMDKKREEKKIIDVLKDLQLTNL
jgi:hypothetical protein